MAHWQRDDKSTAREWYATAANRLEQLNSGPDKVLSNLRYEAQALLGESSRHAPS